MRKIIMQGEANNEMDIGTVFYFFSEHPLELGEKLTFTNHSTTIRTVVSILDKRKNFYEGIIITEDPVANRKDLTHIM